MPKAVVTIFLLLSFASSFSQSTRGTQNMHRARMLLEQEQFRDAELFADSAITAFRLEENRDSLRSAHLLLYEIQLARRNPAGALYNFRRATALGDSIEAIRDQLMTEALNDSIYQQKEVNRVERIRLTAEMERQADASRKSVRNTLIIGGSLLALSLVALLVAYRRITQIHAEQEEGMKELRDLQLFRQKLFTVLSGDLKNLLTSFENLSRGLSTQVQTMSREESAQLLAHLKDTASELRDTVGNVVEWVTFQANAKPFKPESFDCKILAEEIVEKFRWRLDTKDLGADIFIPEDQIVFADREMVGIILESLLSNAVQFTPAGGKITCLSGKKDGLVTIGVKDNGQGIRQEDIEKLFDSREDFHSIGKPDHKGAGVGLLLARDLVERNGGRIYVESTVGEGSTFYFTLPEN